METRVSYMMKTQLVDQISLHEYIPLKSKVKCIDLHPNLPWIVFIDSENSLFVLDVVDKKPIRVLNFQSYFNDPVTVREVVFFNTNDKQYLNNYDLSDIKKIKGLSFNLRSNLLIITLEKQIIFFNYMTKSVIKTLSANDLDGKPGLKCDVFNYKYLIILSGEGNILIWDSIEWSLIQTIPKSLLQKPATNFSIITTKLEETFIIVANAAGNLFSMDILKQNYALTRLNNDKNSHESNVTTIDYNPNTNQIVTFSKNNILIFDLKDPNKFLKLPNFHYVKSARGEGLISNLNNSMINI